MEHTKHIVRAVLLLVLIAVVFVIGRHFAIPESFGDYGHYRSDSVAEYAAQNPVHGAPGACAECHDEQSEALTEGKHASVSCEVCHGPLSRHVEADEMVAEMPVHRSYKLCGWCHQRLASRPKDFPQVTFPDHVTEQNVKMTEAVCLECHDAHNPSEE